MVGGVTRRRLAVDQNAAGAGAAGGGFRPDAPAAFRITFKSRAAERTRRHHRRGAKCRSLGAHFRPIVRCDALHPRRIAALCLLWCAGHSGRPADVAVSLPEKFDAGGRSRNSIAINWMVGRDSVEPKSFLVRARVTLAPPKNAGAD